MKNNMSIWDQLSKTDPKYTKSFGKFGKTLTTTDPMYQIMKMTDMFGPVGEGWTYDVKYNYADMCIFAELKIGWRNNINEPFNWYGPVCAVNPLYQKDKLDDEAPKKAMTDALTKAFSHLGVSADVFLGMFDNNKYVEELKSHFAKKESNAETSTKSNQNFVTKADDNTTQHLNDDSIDIEDIKTRFATAPHLPRLKHLKDVYKEQIKYLQNNNPNAFSIIKKEYESRMEQLNSHK
jgi:uncharacterized short protein YbdD (DUF466 family)